jgi:hypothetical protein
MKFERVMRIINDNVGFRVSFNKNVSNNKIQGVMSDCFPELDETPITTEDEAWDLAKKFYVSTGKIYTVEVVTSQLKSLINSNDRKLQATLHANN